VRRLLLNARSNRTPKTVLGELYRKRGVGSSIRLRIVPEAAEPCAGAQRGCGLGCYLQCAGAYITSRTLMRIYGRSTAPLPIPGDVKSTVVPHRTM
jgi:hypothetical protein